MEKLAITDPFNTLDTQTCTFGHDDLSRIASDSCTGSYGWSQTFSYDPFGNISKSGAQSFQPTYSTSTNQITSIGNCSASYDSNGNVLKDCVNTYAWDSNARPVTINGLGITYDALGRMVERNNAGYITQVVYAPTGNKLAIMTGQTLVWGYVPLPDGTMAQYASGGTVYYRHSDWQGSARLVSSSTRTVYGDVAYGPFGEQYVQSGSTDVMFTGMNQDTYGNIYDFPAREYGIQGRWPSPDPAGMAAANPSNPQSWNRYAYTLNSPLNSVDPLGLFADQCNAVFRHPRAALLEFGTCDYGNQGAAGGGDSGGGCNIDGAEAACSMANSEAEVQCPNNQCSGIGTSANGDTAWVEFVATAGGVSGYYDPQDLTDVYEYQGQLYNYQNYQALLQQQYASQIAAQCGSVSGALSAAAPAGSGASVNCSDEEYIQGGHANFAVNCGTWNNGNCAGRWQDGLHIETDGNGNYWAHDDTASYFIGSGFNWGTFNLGNLFIHGIVDFIGGNTLVYVFPH